MGASPINPWIWTASWLSAVAAYVVLTGFERMAIGLPFATSLLHLAQRAGLVLPAALFSFPLLLMMRRIRSAHLRGGGAFLAYSALGVAYWLAWTSTLYCLSLLGFFDTPTTLSQALAFSAIYCFTVYAAQVLVFESILHLRESQRQEMNSARLHLELSRAEADAFRARLDPDLLFDCFGRITQLMDRDVRQARRAIVNLSELLRASLGCTPDR